MFKRALSSIMRIQRLWRRALRNKSAAAAAMAATAKQPKKTELDSLFDEMEHMLGNQQDDEFEKQNFNAMIIQEQWTAYAHPSRRISGEIPSNRLGMLEWPQQL